MPHKHFASFLIELTDVGQTLLRKRDRVLTNFYPNDTEAPVLSKNPSISVYGPMLE